MGWSFQNDEETKNEPDLLETLGRFPVVRSHLTLTTVEAYQQVSHQSSRHCSDPQQGPRSVAPTAPQSTCNLGGEETANVRWIVSFSALFPLSPHFPYRLLM